MKSNTPVNNALPQYRMDVRMVEINPDYEEYTFTLPELYELRTICMGFRSASESIEKHEDYAMADKWLFRIVSLIKAHHRYGK